MIVLHHFDSALDYLIRLDRNLAFISRVVFRIDIGGAKRFDISSVSVFLFPETIHAWIAWHGMRETRHPIWLLRRRYLGSFSYLRMGWRVPDLD